MAQINPHEERRRLAEFYAGQIDGELEKVASQAYELTDLALEALKTEVARRGLTLKFVDTRPVIATRKAEPQPGDPQPPDPPASEDSGDGELVLRDMVTLRQFRDLPEALLAKGCLDSAGIDCALVDQNMIRLDWFISNLLGGVKLQVNRDDAAVAEEVLSQPIPENFDVSGIGVYDQPHCPKCQSLDVTYKELNNLSYLTAYLNVPIPMHRRAWHCKACNAEWEDEEVQESPASAG
jgi:hypothetical protein